MNPHSLIIDRSLAIAIDQFAIHNQGIPSFSLMEIAGKSAANSLQQLYPDAKRLLFVLGKGNNTGDALVTARYLLWHNPLIEIDLYFVIGNKMNTADAAKNLDLLLNHSSSEQKKRLQFIEDLNTINESSYSVIIDGLFGIGLNRTIKGDLSHQIETLNNCSTPIVALDIPSGLDASDGKQLGISIIAAHTLTFGFDKSGLHLNEGPSKCGQIHILPLSFNIESHIETTSSVGWYCTKISSSSYLKLQSREHEPLHKYAGSAVLILGASEGLTGATISATKSAWANGASAVFLISPAKLASTFDAQLPEAVKWYVGKPSDSYLKWSHLDEIEKKLDYFTGKGMVLCGPGLGSNEETRQLFNHIYKTRTFPSILDADALKMLELEHLGLRQPLILSPHPGEWATICNRLNVAEVCKEDSIESYVETSKWCASHNVQLIRKGSPTIFINEKGSSYICASIKSSKKFNRTGFGDVLAGQIAAMYGRFTKVEDAIIYSLSLGLDSAEKSSDNFDTSELISHLRQQA